MASVRLANAFPVQDSSSNVAKQKKPSDSYLKILIPFKTDGDIRAEYVDAHGLLRLGKLFEILDALAAAIGFKHVDTLGVWDNPPIAIVTAGIESLFMYKEPSPIEDIVMHGCVIMVGKASILVRIEMLQAKDTPKLDSGGLQVIREHEIILLAHFALVALDTKTMRPTLVFGLVPETDQERQWNLRASSPLVMKQELKKRAEAIRGELAAVSPASNDSNALALTVENSRQSKTSPMDPQNRNMFGKVFGGFVLGEAYVVAHTTALLIPGVVQTRLKSMEDSSFLLPVDLGSILTLEGNVVYAKDGDVLVRVAAIVTNPPSHVRSTTNVFYFTFSVGIELTVRAETEHGRELLAFGRENYSRSQARLEKQVFQFEPYQHEVVKAPAIPVAKTPLRYPMHPFPWHHFIRKFY